MRGFYSDVLKGVWKKCKVCYLVGLYSVVLSLILNFLRLGRFIPFELESGAITVNAEELRKYTKLSLDIFKVSNKEALKTMHPGYEDYLIREVSDVRYYVLREKDLSKIVIRGSNNVPNWVSNFMPSMDSTRYGDIHFGYYKLASALFEDLKGYLRKDIPLKIGGASLGGAVSIALAIMLHKEGYKIETVYNIGGPRVSEEDFSYLNVVNFFNILDPVPYLPLANLLDHYRHQGVRVIYDPTDGSIKQYKDSLMTDIYFSPVLLKKELDPSEHQKYWEYAKKWKL